MSDPLLAELLNTPQDEAERELVARYAPVLLFDAHEPFFPLVAGYTVFRESGVSPSFRQGHAVDLTPDGLPPASLAIEYAIWWDWDIGHLYELEHVWVYVDASGDLVRAETSWHGEWHDMRHKGRLMTEGNHLVVYSEPGKHAFAPTPRWFEKRRSEFKRSETGALAGASGVLITPYIEDHIAPTPLDDRLVRTYLARHAFEPSGQFQPYRLDPRSLVPWPALRDWMPRRVQYWLDRLAREVAPADYRFWRIGHRGARAHAPDNTLLSFRTAAELGADMVELDVQRTVDGHIVVVHDAHLVDAHGRVWPVRTSTLAQLRAIDLGQGQRVPTLDKALDLCAQEQIGTYIEIKDGGAIPGTVKAIRDHDWTGHVLIGSFRPDWVAKARAAAPAVRTSVLFGSIHVDAVALARSVGATYVHPCWERYPNPSSLLTPEWIDRVRSAGLGILCWHEERPDEIEALRRLGVDGICSDAPELLI